jgi:hypothetical protein
MKTPRGIHKPSWPSSVPTADSRKTDEPTLGQFFPPTTQRLQPNGCIGRSFTPWTKDSAECCICHNVQNLWNLLNLVKQQENFTSPFHRYPTPPRRGASTAAIKIKDTGHHERCAKADLVHCQPHGIADHHSQPVGSTLGHVTA